MRRTVTLLVVVAMVLSGCQGAPSAESSPTANGSATTAAPTTAPTTSTTPATTEETTTDGGTTTTVDYSDPANVAIPLESGVNVEPPDLPYDQNRTWVRVLEMLDVNYEPPPRITWIANREDAAGSTTGTGSVLLSSTDESVLAHEFTHRVLLGSTEEPETGSADEKFAYDAIVEGTAEYLQVEYRERYMGGNGQLNWNLPRDPGRAYFLSRYYYGYFYVRSQVDSPEELLRVHSNPPPTGEAILHGIPPEEAEVANLSVRPASELFGSDARWRYSGLRTMGELSVLLTLRTRIDGDRAAAAAEGWGNDRVLGLEGQDGRRAFVWAIRWDDEGNATEFVDAAEAYVEADPRPVRPSIGSATPYPAFVREVWGPTDAQFDVRRVGPRTTALVVGPGSFHEDLRLSRDGTSVGVNVTAD